MSAALVINNALNSVFNVALVCSIIYVSYRNIMECKKVRMRPLLFTFGLLLNAVAFTCLCLLFWKSFSQLIHVPCNASNPLFFACNMVFLQHFVLITVLFIRIYYVFRRKLDLALSTRTIRVFIITLVLSFAIFLVLLTTAIHIPGTGAWINCAITLCVFNLLFMIAITSLFLNKLSIVLRFTLENNNSANRTKSDNALIDLITKTTLLSLIAMLTTFISCVLLLFRFSMFGNHPIVSVISDWVVSIDIYCNFACYSLSFKYFHQYYVQICHCCDVQCRQLWFCMVFKVPTDDVLFMSKEITFKPNESNSKPQSSKNISVSVGSEGDVEKHESGSAHQHNQKP
eukprot:255298_1